MTASRFSVHMIGRTAWLRPRAAFGVLLSIPNQLTDFAVNCSKLCRRNLALLRQNGLQPRDGATGLPLFNLLTRPVAEITHSLGMRARAIGPAFEQSCPAAIARTMHGLAGRLEDGLHVVAIDFEAGQSVRCAALGHAGIP